MLSRLATASSFETYVDWLAIAYAITLVCAPALSLPCGHTREGLPVGLQVVAAPNADGRVLAGAKLLEDILALNTVVPVAPNLQGSATGQRS